MTATDVRRGVTPLPPHATAALRVPIPHDPPARAGATIRGAVLLAPLTAGSLQALDIAAHRSSRPLRRIGCGQVDPALDTAGHRAGIGCPARALIPIARAVPGDVDQPEREQHDEENDQPEDDLAHVSPLRRVCTVRVGDESVAAGETLGSQDLSRVEQRRRIECRLDSSHQLDLERCFVVDELIALQLADAVLGADAAAGGDDAIMTFPRTGLRTRCP